MNAHIKYLPTTRERYCRGFTLIEMIGVLTVIAILASLLIPKIFEAISNARANRAVIGMQTVKSAAVEHYARFGSLASSNGTPISVPNSYTNFDLILLTENFIDKPFTSNIGTNSFVRLVNVSGFTPATSVDGSNGAYDLDGDDDNDVTGAGFTLEAVFFNVNPRDAIALNDRLDGATLGLNPGNNDFHGRVIYHRPTPSKPQLRVSVYITHR